MEMRKICSSISSNANICRSTHTWQPQTVLSNVLFDPAENIRKSKVFYVFARIKREHCKHENVVLYFDAGNKKFKKSESISSTVLYMREYRFSLTGFLPYKDRIYDSVFIRENTVQ